MSSAINYLGIAQKAGSLQTGELNSGAAVRAGKARVLLLAHDASKNARNRAEGFVHGGKTPIVSLPYTKEQLSAATGKAGWSMAAITDIGLSAAFMAAFAEEEPSAKELALLLSEKNEKARKRKSEDKAHKRNVKTGKSAKGAAPGMRRKNI